MLKQPKATASEILKISAWNPYENSGMFYKTLQQSSPLSHTKKRKIQKTYSHKNVVCLFFFPCSILLQGIMRVLYLLSVLVIQKIIKKMNSESCANLFEIEIEAICNALTVRDPYFT